MVHYSRKKKSTSISYISKRSRQIVTGLRIVGQCFYEASLQAAREIFSQLPVKDCAKYDTFKELILKGYELVPGMYRQRFRGLVKTGSKTFIEFAQEKSQLFDRWCMSENANGDYDSLRELILIYEFKNCLSTDIRTVFNDKNPNTLTDFSLTHKLSITSVKPNSSLPLEAIFFFFFIIKKALLA